MPEKCFINFYIKTLTMGKQLDVRPSVCREGFSASILKVESGVFSIDILFFFLSFYFL